MYFYKSGSYHFCAYLRHLLKEDLCLKWGISDVNIGLWIFLDWRKNIGINLDCAFTWPVKRFNRLEEVKRCRLFLWRCYFLFWLAMGSSVQDKPRHVKSGECMVFTVTLAPSNTSGSPDGEHQGFLWDTHSPGTLYCKMALEVYPSFFFHLLYVE